jgi:hypothetical protein
VLIKTSHREEGLYYHPITAPVVITIDEEEWMYYHHFTGQFVNYTSTSTLPKGTLGSVTSFLAATLYQKHPGRNYKLWNIVSSERYILKDCITICLRGRL